MAKSNYKVAEGNPSMLFMPSPSTDNPLQGDVGCLFEREKASTRDGQLDKRTSVKTRDKRVKGKAGKEVSKQTG